MVHVRGINFHYRADSDIELILDLFDISTFPCFYNIHGLLGLIDVFCI